MSKQFSKNKMRLSVPIEQKSDNTEVPINKTTFSIIFKFLQYLFFMNIYFCKMQKLNNKIPEIQHSQKLDQEIINSMIGITKHIPSITCNEFKTIFRGPNTFSS